MNSCSSDSQPYILKHYIILFLSIIHFLFIHPANILLDVYICLVLHWVLEVSVKVNDPERGWEGINYQVLQYNVIRMWGCEQSAGEIFCREKEVTLGLSLSKSCEKVPSFSAS